MSRKLHSLLVLTTAALAGILILAGLAFGNLGPTIKEIKEKPLITRGKPPLPTVTPSPTLTPTPTPIPVGLPTEIQIPKLKVRARIVAVGASQDRVMSIPKDASEVGWFIESPRPGQWGAAILNGHYDTPSGRPAIFYNLEKLVAGDEIIILTEWEERFVFRVEQVLSQSYKTFPKELVYGNVTGRELRLITCDGVWNPEERSYSNRLVVFSRLW